MGGARGGGEEDAVNSGQPRMRVAFIENPWLPPMKPGEMMRFAPMSPGDPVTFAAKPGELTPERIGRLVNRLRDEGFEVEVIGSAVPPDEKGSLP